MHLIAAGQRNKRVIIVARPTPSASVKAVGLPGRPGVNGDAGADARQVEFQSSVTHIQWRRVGDAAWSDLLPLTAIEGAPGDAGPPGVGVPVGGTTGQVLAKLSTANHDTGWVNQTGGAGGGSVAIGDLRMALTNPGEGWAAGGQVLSQAGSPELYSQLGVGLGAFTTTRTYTGSASNSHAAIAAFAGYLWVIRLLNSVYRLQRTADGVTWEDTGITGYPFMVASNGRLGLLGTSSFNSFTYTTDGETWSTPGQPGAYTWNALAWTGQNWIVHSNGSVCRYSPDGITWTTVTTGFGASTANWLDSNGAGVVVAVGGTGRRAYSTNHGVTWTYAAYGTASYESVTWTGDRFIAVSSASSLAQHSVDGIAWTVMTLPVYRRVHWTGGANYMQVLGTTYISTDGGLTWTADATWSPVASGTLFSYGAQLAKLPGSPLRLMRMGSNILLVQREDSKSAYWVVAETPSGRLAVRGQRVLMAGGSGISASADAGLTWVRPATPAAVSYSDMNSIAALALTGSVMYRSTDMINWDVVADAPIGPICVVGDTFFVVNATGTYTSATGVSWVQQDAGPGVLPTSTLVTLDGELFCRQSTSLFQRLTDGTWLNHPAGPNQGNELVAGNGALVYVGSNSYGLYACEVASLSSGAGWAKALDGGSLGGPYFVFNRFALRSTPMQSFNGAVWGDATFSTIGNTSGPLAESAGVLYGFDSSALTFYVMTPTVPEGSFVVPPLPPAAYIKT
ncbi:MAG TPA: hypothetical protein VIZ86_16750 [Pseudomonas sp.]